MGTDDEDIWMVNNGTTLYMQLSDTDGDGLF
jgi:hypothetical protein